jgi:hypothetical protein
MGKRRLITLSAAVSCLGTAALAMTWITGLGDATNSPFTPVAATGNIAALVGRPLFLPPSAVEHLPADIRPGGSAGNTHPVGGGGTIWTHGTGVCVQVSSGAAGCFSTFTKPVDLYLVGTETHSGVYGGAKVEGVVPDSVKTLTLIMDNGADVATKISQNGFSVSVPDGVGVSGYEVTLADGAQFTMDDPVAVPHFAP